ncbi:MAG: DMT family transporter [Gemmatimonadales bacterium]
MSADSATAPRAPVLAAHVALVGAQVCFGLIPVFGLIAFRPGGFTPLGLTAWRLTAGAAILLALAFAVHGRAAFPARADVPRFAIAGALGVALNQWLFLEGLSRSTAINAALMMCLIPVFTIALATAVGIERLRVSRVAGVLVAMAGTVLLLLDRGLSRFGPYAFGTSLMACNALLYAGFLIVAKPLAQRYPPLVMMAWAYALSLPFAPVLALGQRLTPEPGHAAAWWSLAYIIVFPTVLSYLLNGFALARVRASTTAIYVYLQPFIAALASWVAFREQPTAAMLLAALVLFTGVWLVSRRSGEEA